MPKPQPSAVLTPDPGLPTGILPPDIQDWLSATALLAGVSPVMVTVPFLAGTGAVLGSRLPLTIHPGWTEYPALWVALITLTGGGKTPALDAVARPFDHLHREELAAWSARTTDPAAEPFAPLLATTAPWSRLHTTLQQTNGLLLFRDELFGFIRAIDRRSGEDRQFYLSLWSTSPVIGGTSPVRTHPVVSIVGGIQPLLIHRIRHRYQDGLLERFLLVLTKSPSPGWNHDLPTEAPSLDPILEVLRPLRAITPGQPVTFDRHARHAWASWYDANDELIRTAPLPVQGYYQKLPTQLARLALILHALWHPTAPHHPLTGATLDRAITLVEYLRIHLHRSITLINERHPHRSPADLLTSRIAIILAQHKEQDGWMNRSRLALKLGRPPTAPFATAVDAMLAAQILDERHVPTGGRTATQYRLSPSLQNLEKPSKRNPPEIAEFDPVRELEALEQRFLSRLKEPAS